MATHSSILAWRVPRTEEPAWWATVHRVAKSQTQLKQLSTHTNAYRYIHLKSDLSSLLFLYVPFNQKVINRCLQVC